MITPPISSKTAISGLFLALCLAAPVAAQIKAFKNGDVANADDVNKNFTTVNNNAAAAQAAANSSLSKANAAQTSASSALSRANTAQTTANSAKSTANNLANAVNPLLATVRATSAKRLGIRMTSPQSDIHLLQSGSGYSSSGLQLDWSTSTASDRWKVLNTGLFFSFILKDGTKAWKRVAYVAQDGSWVKVSDRRLKKDIRPISSVLGRVLELRPVSYHYKSDSPETQRSEGFIAQDVEKLFPTAVSEMDGEIPEDGVPLRGIKYADFAVIAIKAIQEQQAMIKKLQERISNLEKKTVK